MDSDELIDGSHPDYLREKIATLERQLNDLREKLEGKWISVETGYPKEKQRVNVYFGKAPEPYMDTWTYDGTNQYFKPNSKAETKDCVTHWQPLPPAPKEA